MSILTGKTHYMSFRHLSTGLTNPDWTVRIFQNGELRLDIGYEVREVFTYYYTVTFDNDGPHNSQWIALAFPKAAPGMGYTDSWEVAKPITEAAVTAINSRMNTADGGFFGFSSKDE